MPSTTGKHCKAQDSPGPRLVAAVLARIGLGVATIVILWTLALVPFGWSTVVVSSGSMTPRLRVGDLVLSQPPTAGQARPGRFVLVENPAQPGTLLLHRLVRRDFDGALITKGDANATVDSSPVPVSSVRGLPRFSIRYAGLPVVWFRTGAHFPLGLSVATLAVLVVLAFPRWHRPRHRVVPPVPALVRVQRAAPAGMALLLISALVAGRVPIARSKYVAKTLTASNSWQTGTVTFGANSPTGALFAVTGAIPGSIGSKCIVVTYTGSITSEVRMYVPSVTGALGTNLVLQIREGTGTSSTCSDFTSSGVDYNPAGLTDTTKTLAAFVAASSNYATGAGSWSAATSATRTYQISWALLPADNVAGGRTASFSLVWEAHG